MYVRMYVCMYGFTYFMYICSMCVCLYVQYVQYVCMHVCMYVLYLLGQVFASFSDGSVGLFDDRVYSDGGRVKYARNHKACSIYLCMYVCMYVYMCFEIYIYICIVIHTFIHAMYIQGWIISAHMRVDLMEVITGTARCLYHTHTYYIQFLTYTYYIHTYIHTYNGSHRGTVSFWDLRTMRAYKSFEVHKVLHTYIYIHTFIHTYIHTLYCVRTWLP